MMNFDNDNSFLDSLDEEDSYDEYKSLLSRKFKKKAYNIRNSS